MLNSHTRFLRSLALAGALAICNGLALAAPMPADLVLTDARIYTADAARSMAEAVAVRDGRIVYVGKKAGAQAFIGPATKVEHLGGRLVLPGLIDSHVHADEMVRLDVCDLKNEPKSLAGITAFVQECIRRYQIADGDWVVVRHWNYSYGNVPDASHPTLRAALDLASARSPVHLDGDDGHHSAFNSLALARARNAAGATIGYSRATLRGELQRYSRLVGVDVAGEPNGTVNDDGRNPLDVPSTFMLDLGILMKDPGRVTALLNSAGITGILDPRVSPQALQLFDELEKSSKLTVRAHIALYFDPESMQTPNGQPDWDRMVSTAVALRERYAHDPLIRADSVKIFADGDMEGNPHAVPPTLPQVAALKPYLQPIFKSGADGRLTVTGYVDTASALCAEVRAHPERYDTPANATAFLAERGYHPGQCAISSGQLEDDRAVILELVRRFHLAGFAVHIHTIGDVAVRTAVDAIEAARAVDGIATQHDALAHVQLADPDDVRRIGRDRLYVAFTYAWAVAEPEYDLSVVPFIDKVIGNDHAALHPKDGFYENNAYPARSVKAAGATLVAGSDAPVDTDDPRPFVNMAVAVTRRMPGLAPLNPRQGIAIRDVLDAYTINGARYLDIDHDAGSIELGKSADLVVVDQDILALADQGKADDIARTHALETWFMGRSVYRRVADPK
jgi:hypothetical protein